MKKALPEQGLILLSRASTDAVMTARVAAL